jgi:pyruvate formate lyase activating enzyme
VTPREAAQRITQARHDFVVDRMAISGGECTLNKPWLILYLEELKKLNPDAQARLHVDTNGSLLTPEYLDELIQEGMTDIGIDLKGLTVQTYQLITGINDQALAQTYLDNAWTAVRYLINQYHDQIFVGVGIPYNKELISMAEIKKMGQKLFKIDPHLQVCVLDYRPEFRCKITRPSDEEMMEVRNLLKDTGLSVVLCQTATGHIGP